ncbi:MAG: tRNA lysidine(34) synthetase TilS, partial [Vicinamibacteria bacterium]
GSPKILMLSGLGPAEELKRHGIACVADLPGVRMERSGADVVLLISGLAVPPAKVEPVWLPLDVPGEARLPGGAAVRAFHGRWEGANPDGRHVALVDPARLTWPLAVRTRRPGDRLRPGGLGGRKKVQDLLVDRKVPRGRRDEVPIVVDGAGRIVWVAGHALDEAFRVTDLSGAVVVLELVPTRA